MESALDKFSDTARQFVHVHHIGNLGADFAHEIELVQAKSFDPYSVRGKQTDGYDIGQAFKQFDFFLWKSILILMVDL